MGLELLEGTDLATSRPSAPLINALGSTEQRVELSLGTSQKRPFAKWPLTARVWIAHP